MTFISEIAPHAQRIQKEFGILASLVIAQACLESNYGKSGLAVNGKNLFGIKGAYNGQSVTMKTTEYVNGKPVKVNASFRKYPSWYESLCDLANLYKNGVSWDRNKYKNVIGETDYKKAAKKVQSDGYATDPKYADKLIATIESNKLTQYDAVAKPAQKETVKFKEGQKVKIRSSAKYYATGQTIPERVKNKQYTIMQIKGDKALIKEIYSWVKQSDLA
ncbi:glycoside hydrolase family 73 protein [Bacillus sp. FJAT-49736]|nr:glycoside hydrolase family 73 protein [Bacillus sp. FJAT-49736]